MQMAAGVLFPQEWVKTLNPNSGCPDNDLIESGNPNYWQHEIDGCSVFFVSKRKDSFGFYSIVYCYIPDSLYRELLDAENAKLPFGEPKHENLDPNTKFAFDEQLLNGNEPRYEL